MFAGVLSEKPKDDGVLGEVGGMIVADGFKRMRSGDRFWY